LMGNISFLSKLILARISEFHSFFGNKIKNNKNIFISLNFFLIGICNYTHVQDLLKLISIL